MATKSEADLALAFHQRDLFQTIPYLTKISVVETRPYSGEFVLEAGVVDLKLVAGASGTKLPSELAIPGQLTNEKINLRIVETGELKPFAGVFSARSRPAQGGDSVGRGGGPDTGTLGSAILLRGAGGSNEYLLSCWHVLVGASGRLGDPIIQPSPRDRGASPADDVGDLHWYLLDSEFDVAIAKTRQVPSANLTAGCRCTLCGSASMPSAPTLNAIVAKCGMTSGLTLGIIRSVNASVALPGYPTGNWLFTNQIETTAMAFAGDSGSVLFNYDKGNDPVGLLVGGGASASFFNNLSVLFGRALAPRIVTYPDGTKDRLPAVNFLSL